MLIVGQNPLASILWNDKTQDIELTLFSVEAGQNIIMKFTPEKTITAYEMTLINNMICILLSGGLKLHETSLVFIRKHNLERHFTFSSP